MAVRAKVDMLIDPVLNGRLAAGGAAVRRRSGWAWSRPMRWSPAEHTRGSGRAGDGHDRGLGPAAIGQEHRGRLQRSAHRIPGGEPGVQVKVTTFPYIQYRDKLLVAVRRHGARRDVAR